MKFFANAGSATEVSELLEQSKAYMEYLQCVKERLPLSAFEFATAAWHYSATTQLPAIFPYFRATHRHSSLAGRLVRRPLECGGSTPHSTVAASVLT
jgi:hypothetical protein